MEIYEIIYMVIVFCVSLPAIIYIIAWWIDEVISAIKYLIRKIK